MWANSKGSERLTAILLFQNWLVVPCVPCELLPLKEQKEFLRIRQLESKHISLFLKSSYNPNDTQIPLTYTPPKWCGGLGLEYRCPPDLYFWVRNIPVLIILDITYTLHLLLGHICFSYKEKGWHFSAMTVTKNFPLQLPRCSHTTACALFGAAFPFQQLGPGNRGSMDPKSLVMPESFKTFFYGCWAPKTLSDFWGRNAGHLTKSFLSRVLEGMWPEN